jgi:hypothetical protein
MQMHAHLHIVVCIRDWSLALHLKFAARRHTEVDVINLVGPVVVISQDDLTQDSVLEGSLPVTSSLLRCASPCE